jgi:tetraacyldisaccharide 4'-kinase
MLLIRVLLLPLLPLYWIIIQLRSFLFSCKIFKSQSLSPFVISVGNLSFGGTGKTPMVIALTQWLLDQNITVAILTRGYGRSTNKTLLVSPNPEEKLAWQATGDEPFLMAKKLPTVPIVADSNRIRGGQFLVENFNPRVIILDDGFQHLAIKRDFNLLLINSSDSVSGLALFPFGKLREPWNSIKRADALILTKSNIFTPTAALREKINSTNIPCYDGVLIKASEFQGINNRKISEKELKNKTALLISAIGDPESFVKAAANIPIKIAEHIYFRDHHRFNSKDVEKILNTFLNSEASIILTTEKDLVRFEALIPDKIPLYALPISVHIPEQIKKTIFALLGTA